MLPEEQCPYCRRGGVEDRVFPLFYQLRYETRCCAACLAPWEARMEMARDDLVQYYRFLMEHIVDAVASWNAKRLLLKAPSVDVASAVQELRPLLARMVEGVELFQGHEDDLDVLHGAHTMLVLDLEEDEEQEETAAEGQEQEDTEEEEEEKMAEMLAFALQQELKRDWESIGTLIQQRTQHFARTFSAFSLGNG